MSHSYWLLLLSLIAGCRPSPVASALLDTSGGPKLVLTPGNAATPYDNILLFGYKSPDGATQIAWALDLPLLDQPNALRQALIVAGSGPVVGETLISPVTLPAATAADAANGDVIKVRVEVAEFLAAFSNEQDAYLKALGAGTQATMSGDLAPAVLQGPIADLGAAFSKALAASPPAADLGVSESPAHQPPANTLADARTMAGANHLKADAAALSSAIQAGDADRYGLVMNDLLVLMQDPGLIADAKTVVAMQHFAGFLHGLPLDGVVAALYAQAGAPNDALPLDARVAINQLNMLSRTAADRRPLVLGIAVIAADAQAGSPSLDTDPAAVALKARAGDQAGLKAALAAMQPMTDERFDAEMTALMALVND